MLAQIEIYVPYIYLFQICTVRFTKVRLGQGVFHTNSFEGTSSSP